jgi:hypothetical protein
MTPLTPLLAVSLQLDKWGRGEFFDAFVAGVAEAGSVAAVAAIVATMLYLGLYWWSQSHTLPVTTMVLMGAGTIPLLPAPMQRVAWIIILLAGSVALFAILWLVIR